ncbi:Regulator of phospholipase D [Komagataella phaffii CBS 7435]|uniref:Regulator of phospholipase D SRF1 n=2 Tax=Komagataella phaffii TaxID=460519 RepID=C4QWR5_KOMPG|nr:uncharacterized protein PAS_chr1-1_0311 [Komagataella phaffii GS115]AOA61521.1 GQ67_02897T0 [Komagataella phaffii]CAH2446457.1 Regulator of phospholipase D [Komagataella phaffii CBS 7435]AOA65617.1 GQ68_02350T0 [Komagataella phaffii GS115]CAY67688.1 Putative protein of unknown function [Komagataella phaffii GS115]CCA36780.1 Regulator of phospholipase D [Komagataella phaffii CBS 7435]
MSNNKTQSHKRDSAALPSSKRNNSNCSSLEAPDPFGESQNNYNHNVQPFPPYVLDRIAKAYHGKNELNEQNSDPFVSTLYDDWCQFLETIEARQAYPSELLTKDNSTDSNSELEKEWGGHERLRRELGEEGKMEKAKGRMSLLAFFFGKGDSSKEKAKVRSRYWMTYERRESWKITFERIIFSNPYIPLSFRLITMIFTIISLAIACHIMVLSKRKYFNDESIDQQPSTIMAVVVQSCALVYLSYIAWDEFHGQPLGLRDPVAKMSLILFDLLFIIFCAADLSLTFNTLYDTRWVCQADVTLSYDNVVAPLCDRQQGLAGFLFITLITWVITFAISLFRVVARVSPSA